MIKVTIITVVGILTIIRGVNYSADVITKKQRDNNEETPKSRLICSFP